MLRRGAPSNDGPLNFLRNHQEWLSDEIPWPLRNHGPGTPQCAKTRQQSLIVARAKGQPEKPKTDGRHLPSSFPSVSAKRRGGKGAVRHKRQKPASGHGRSSAFLGKPGALLLRQGNAWPLGNCYVSLNSLKNKYQFRVLKKWCDRLCWGPGARMERARSIGRVAPWRRRSKRVSSDGGGGYLPRPIHGEISALWFQAGRSGPRALEALGPYAAPFFKELKCYKFLNSH